VLKPGGSAFITIPWSARYHYIPYDYARYTPSKLEELFSAFRIDALLPRGSDIAVIGNKMVVIAAQQVTAPSGKWWRLPLLALASPLFAGAVLWAHAAIWFDLGSKNDPLGYTLRLTKLWYACENRHVPGGNGEGKMPDFRLLQPFA
jgi:hypothetical protein